MDRSRESEEEGEEGWGEHAEMGKRGGKSARSMQICMHTE